MTDDNDTMAGEGGDDLLVAEYVLGVLDADEHDAVARRIAADPVLQAEETFWLAKFSGLDDQFTETPAPSSTWTSLERRLFGPPETPVRDRFWNSVATWRALAGGCAAALVLVLALYLAQPVPTGPGQTGPQLVASLEAQDSDVKFLAVYDQASGHVRLTSLSGEPVSGKDYELWIIQGKAAPVSLGVIPVDTASDVILTGQMRAGVNDQTVFAVTLEPLGGAPNGVPTGPIVAAGPVTRV